MKKPFAAYKGTESYAFVCYAHRDSESVYADLLRLNGHGINLWYDEGIPAGTAWRGEIAAAIKGAEKFLFFISKASLTSSHCLREVDYAINHDIEIIPVYLDDSSLPAELDLVLNRVHALFRKTDTMYSEHLLESLQGRTLFAPLVRRTGKRKFRIGASVLAAAVVAVVMFSWSSWEKSDTGSQSDSSRISVPNAYDRYLEGLELIKRWDKGDNLEQAIEVFREASSLDPSFALAFARLADALRMRYALTRDETWLEQAAASADEAMRLNAGLAPVQVALGRIHAARGNTDLAFAAIERAVSIDPNDASANQAIASLFAKLGRIEDAEASFQKAVALDPGNPLILDSYANFLFAQSRYADAARQWQSVVRLAPDNYGALANLGSALNESGRIAEAITMYQRSIAIRPTYMVYSNLGTAYGRAERYSDAIDAYKKALEIDETDWLAWGNLAYVYSWKNGTDQLAIETFERAIQLAEAARQQYPRDPFVHSDLALYYAKIGKTELALQRVATALALSPDSGEIQAAAAEAYEIIGQRDKAIELVQQSLALGYPQQHFQRNLEFENLLDDPRMQASP